MRNGHAAFIPRMDAVVDPRVRVGIQIRVQTVRKASGRRLTELDGSDSFSGSSGEQTGLHENPKPLFSGSFLAENVCWGARRGTSPVSERFFWEATPCGVHP